MQANEDVLEQEVARQLQRVADLQGELHRTRAAAEAAHNTAAVREAELLGELEAREAALQAARVRPTLADPCTHHLAQVARCCHGHPFMRRCAQR